MNKRFILMALMIIVAAALAATAYFGSRTEKPKTSPLPEPEAQPSISENEARIIAQKTCIKGGEALDAGAWDETSQSWKFGANLNAMRPGCVPTCDVSAQTKTASLNWNCAENNETASSTIACEDADRGPRKECPAVEDPVCATVQIQCVKTPCNPIKENFENACEACRNPLVLEYAEGECSGQ